MATFLTITANTLLDHLVTSPLVAGEVNRVPSFTLQAGGKGVNVARVLRAHGHRVLVTGFSGGASGAVLRDLVAADGMEPHFVPTAARTRTGFLCMHPGGGKTSLLENGFQVSAQEQLQLVAQCERLLAGTQLVVIGGSVPDPSCVALYRLILEACARAQVPCWVDAYGAVMDEALGSRHPPALVKPNLAEYGTNHRRWLPASELHLTDGGNEIRVRHPEGRFRVQPPRVLERNPVGSGDCYLAALAHGRSCGWDLYTQLRYAAAAGAANAASGQVARITPEEISALVGEVSIRTSSD
jgi:tagatose 6-phosphate kinase